MIAAVEDTGQCAQAAHEEHTGPNRTGLAVQISLTEAADDHACRHTPQTGKVCIPCAHGGLCEEVYIVLQVPLDTDNNEDYDAVENNVYDELIYHVLGVIAGAAFDSASLVISAKVP